MPVSKRHDSAPDAWWARFSVNGKRYQITIRAPNKRAAEALERDARRRAEAGAGRTQNSATVGAAFARYWQEHGRFLASKGSERGYLNRWADSLGDGAIFADVTAETVASCVAAWRTPPGQRLDTKRQPKDRQRVSDSTINHRLLCLQRIWNRAEELWGWQLPRIPWRRLKLPERKELPDRSIDRATLRALLRALPARSRPIVMLAIVTGLRRGALLRMESSDVDWQAAVLRAISKGRAGGKLTPVPITRAARWCLRRHIQSRDCTYPHIQHVGRLFPVTMQQLRHDWEAAKRAIGRPDLRFHDLRHTFAQRLEDAGMGDMISYALHHGDPKLRERYSKVRLETLRQRLDSRGKRRVGSDGQAPLRRMGV